MSKENEKNLLEIENLFVEYHTARKVVKAVNGVSFSIKRGETLGLVGETGAGKTTIAKAILRILPSPQSKITKGRINFNERELLELPEKKMRKVRGNKISMIFQDPMTALNPIEKVGAQIAETISVHEKMSKLEAQQRAVNILELVGIPGDRYNEYPHQFSGGMKQRVVIAMAIACKPELLIADEPTTALDVTIQAQVLNMMYKLKQELDTSVIMITHDLGIIAEMCDHVAVVYAGEIIEKGTLEDVFDHASHPYTIGLFNSVPKLIGKERRLSPINGLMPDPTNLPAGCNFSDRCPFVEAKCKEREPDVLEIRPGHFVKCIKPKEGK